MRRRYLFACYWFFIVESRVSKVVVIRVNMVLYLRISMPTRYKKLGIKWTKLTNKFVWPAHWLSFINYLKFNYINNWIISFIVKSISEGSERGYSYNIQIISCGPSTPWPITYEFRITIKWKNQLFCYKLAQNFVLGSSKNFSLMAMGCYAINELYNFNKIDNNKKISKYAKLHIYTFIIHYIIITILKFCDIKYY